MNRGNSEEYFLKIVNPLTSFERGGGGLIVSFSFKKVKIKSTSRA